MLRVRSRCKTAVLLTLKESCHMKDKHTWCTVVYMWMVWVVLGGAQSWPPPLSSWLPPPPYVSSVSCDASSPPLPVLPPSPRTAVWTWILGDWVQVEYLGILLGADPAVMSSGGCNKPHIARFGLHATHFINSK